MDAFTFRVRGMAYALDRDVAQHLASALNGAYFHYIDSQDERFFYGVHVGDRIAKASYGWNHPEMELAGVHASDVLEVLDDEFVAGREGLLALRVALRQPCGQTDSP